MQKKIKSSISAMGIAAMMITTIIATMVLIFPMLRVSASDGFRSQGRIVYTNGTPETEDDVIFDASDLDRLAEICR